jgi:hypothetical protein
MTDHAKLYAQGHLAASHAGESAFRAAAHRYRDSQWGPELARLRDDVADDRRSLEQLASHLGVDVGSAVHRVARTSLSVLGGATRWVHTRGDLGPVTEVEKLRQAVAAKLAGWEVLLAASAKDDRLSRTRIEELIARARDQLDRLRSCHLQMAQQVFDHDSVDASEERRSG